MKILGIDFGFQKLGLAIAEEGLVRPLTVLRQKNSLKKIEEICQANQIKKIIIGISAGQVAKRARNFGQKLIQTTGLMVDFQDETLTTKEALVKMIQVGKKRKFRQEKEDAFAAACILQAYLEK